MEHGLSNEDRQTYTFAILLGLTLELHRPKPVTTYRAMRSCDLATLSIDPLFSSSRLKQTLLEQSLWLVWAKCDARVFWLTYLYSCNLY
jgi:hypothetical protein